MDSYIDEISPMFWLPGLRSESDIIEICKRDANYGSRGTKLILAYLLMRGNSPRLCYCAIKILGIRKISIQPRYGLNSTYNFSASVEMQKYVNGVLTTVFWAPIVRKLDDAEIAEMKIVMNENNDEKLAIKIWHYNFWECKIIDGFLRSMNFDRIVRKCGEICWVREFDVPVKIPVRPRILPKKCIIN